MTDEEKLERLEYWAVMAAQELQEFIDAAQECAGDPDGDNELPGTRQLIKELDGIIYADWKDELSALGVEIAALNDA